MIDSFVDVAIEIPVLPKMEKEILSLISLGLIRQGVQWVNLNELEFSERNCDAFLSQGYRVKNDISAAVKGSEQTAVKIIKMSQKKDLRNWSSLLFRFI